MTRSLYTFLQEVKLNFTSSECDLNFLTASTNTAAESNECRFLVSGYNRLEAHNVAISLPWIILIPGDDVRLQATLLPWPPHASHIFHKAASAILLHPFQGSPFSPHKVKTPESCLPLCTTGVSDRALVASLPRSPIPPALVPSCFSPFLNTACLHHARYTPASGLCS